MSDSPATKPRTASHHMKIRHQSLCAAIVAVAALAGCENSRIGGAGATAEAGRSAFALANGCHALVTDDGRPVIKADDGYALTDADEATAFTMRPTALGKYLFYDADAQVMAVDTSLGGGGVQSASQIDDTAEWHIEYDEATGFTVASTATGEFLAISDDGRLELAAQGASFDFAAAQGCLPFPEAELGATGQTFRGTNPDGTVRGIADAHTHISAYQRLGGRFIHGDAFHRFGVAEALRDCAENHGPDGRSDFVGHFVREGAPVGSHQTAGWPDFPEWPSSGTYSHQQTYYIWVKRAWMAGLRLLVNHTSADEQLCQINPVRDTDCVEMNQVRRQVAGLFDLQDYIDAQNGGPGEGWFRIVRTPGAARQVIAEGKLAVVIGIEASKLFECGEYLDAPECGEAEIDAGIDEFFDLGVRAVFINHWFDNAFGGAGLFGQSEVELNALNKPETGHYFRVEGCPEPGMGANLMSVVPPIDADNPVADAINAAFLTAAPSYPPGPHCNAKGLTGLGEYVIRKLAARGIIIETDHIGAKMKNQVLDIVESLDYPVVAGHYHAGGTSSSTQLSRILGVGGIAAPIKPAADDYAGKVRELETIRDPDHFFAVPMSTDSGGIASLPGAPDDDEVTIQYPFRSRFGDVSFTQQVTGNRRFDYNAEGIAHYGLFAEWIEAVGRAPDGDHAVESLFNSAEAYLQMWERTGVAD